MHSTPQHSMTACRNVQTAFLWQDPNAAWQQLPSIFILFVRLHAACIAYPKQCAPPLPPSPPPPPLPFKVVTSSISSPLPHLLLPCVQEWNQLGVARMCHMLTVLQPAVASLAGASSSDAGRQFDKARLYFSLLMYSPDGLQRAIMDKPGRFTLSEYTALLQVRLQ